MEFTRNPLDAAIYYLRLGFTPIPLCTPANGVGGCEQHGPLCSHPGKRPLVKGWNTCVVTEDDLQKWWQRWPTANIGAVMGGGIVGIDIDPRNGGRETLEKLDLKRPDTAVSITGGAGEHWFFRTNGKAVAARVLGPGVELHGTNTTLVLPPSMHKSGKRYQWMPGYHPSHCDLATLPDELALAVSNDHKILEVSSKRPRLTTSDWVDDALRANGISKIEFWNLEERHRQLLRLWHEGVPEGRRWLTLRAILREALDYDVPANDIGIIAKYFAARCTPPFPQNEAERLASWFRSKSLPEPVVQFSPHRVGVEAWEHGYWLRRDLQKARSGGPNGEPIISPLYLPRKSVNSESKHTKISTEDALAKWLNNLRSLPNADWRLVSSEEELAKHTLDEISRCGGPGVRNCGLHRTKSAHRPCRLSFHDRCESTLQTKARVAAYLGTDSGAAGTFLNGPLTLIRVAVPLPWPWVSSGLDAAWLQLKRAIPRLKKRLPQGAICAFRLEPFRGAMTVYLLAPGMITDETEEHRGRPPAYELSIIGNPQFSSYKAWKEQVGGSWCNYVPNDDNAPDAALQLLLWSRNFAQQQGKGKSRTWGIGLLGKALVNMRLIHPCPVCGKATRDDGWFDSITMEELPCIDQNGRSYTGVITRGPPPI